MKNSSGVKPNSGKTIARIVRGFFGGFFKCGRERVGLRSRDASGYEADEKVKSNRREADRSYQKVDGIPVDRNMPPYFESIRQGG